MRELGATRLSVTRTPRHIYAQVLSPDGGTTPTVSQEEAFEEAARKAAEAFAPALEELEEPLKELASAASKAWLSFFSR